MSAPLLFAHRGASRELPENTLPSFRLAVELGASFVETDAHMTRDGRLVLSHDETGARMAGVADRISDCTLAQIKRWDAGKKFLDAQGKRPFEGKGYEVPTLEEALAEFPETRFNIDIKDNDLHAADTMLRLLEREGASQRVRLASFHTRVIRHVRGRGYPGGTSLGFWEGVWLALGGRPRLHFPAGTAAQIPCKMGPIRSDTPAFLARCRRLGLAVHYWTINDPDEARRLLALGADGIMTDDPRAILPVMRAPA